MKKTVSFRISVDDDNSLVLAVKDTVLKYNERGELTTENCPYHWIEVAYRTQLAYYKSSNIIAQRENANNMEVLKYLVQGFSPTAIKHITSNYTKDEFILGIYNSVMYVVPKYIYELITNYESRGESLNIYFPTQNITSYDGVKKEIEETNANVNEEDKLETASLLDNSYFNEVCASILFGERKLKA
jgi:hypothetical protein